MKYRRTIVIVVAALAVGVLAFRALRAEPRRVTLPDGSIVEFIGTSVGTEVFSTEQPWHKAARRVLPARFHGWLPAVSRASCSSGTNSITVFVQVTNPTGNPAGNSPWQGYRAEDDNGFFYNHDGGSCSFGGGASSRIYGLSLKAYPRRQGSFRFHFLDASNTTIGTLRIPNPVKGPFPSWIAQPLPQTLTNGPLIVTAERLRRQSNKSWQGVSARWRADALVPHWRRARARSTTLLDATGNDAQWLALTEPAWKLRTTFHRERDDDFLPDERWRLDNIPVPANGRFVAVDQTNTILGVTIVAQVVSPPGTFYITNGIHRALDTNRVNGGFSGWTGNNVEVKSWGYDKPFVMIEAYDRQENDEVRLKLFNERGLELKSAGNERISQGDANGLVRYVQRFDIPPETKSLALEVIINRPLVFEFMVDPKDLPPAKPTEPK